MRTVPLLVAALALLPAAGADAGRGALYGADAGAASAGAWDLWFVHVSAAGRLEAGLTWSQSPLGVDYDLTLWRAGAADDGVLAQEEILDASWTHATVPHREDVAALVAPDARPYVLTVEAVRAQGEPYALAETGGTLARVCHLLSPPGACVPASAGAKLTPP